MEICETHPLITLKPGSGLSEALDALVSRDRTLGNVAECEPNVGQIVQGRGDRLWYASGQPNRATRPGLGLNLPPSETPIFFKNVVSKGTQGWIRFCSGGTELVAYANPKPHMPGTVLITKIDADLQTWRADSPAATVERIKDLARLLVALSWHLPDRYVSFNNMYAGHSLNQWHVSVNTPPPGIEQWPVEQQIKREMFRSRAGLLALGGSNSYPAPVFTAIGKPDYVAEKLVDAIVDWDTLPEATGNLTVVQHSQSGVVTGLFWPRISTWRRAPGFQSGEIASLELAGYFLLSHESDLAGVASGKYSYPHFWRVLRSVADPRAFERCPTWVR